MLIYIIIHVFGGLIEQPHVFIGEQNKNKAQAKFDELKKGIRKDYDALEWWEYDHSEKAKFIKYDLIDSI